MHWFEQKLKRGVGFVESWDDKNGMIWVFILVAETRGTSWRLES